MSSKPPCPECAALRAEVAQLAVLTRERDEWKVRVGRQTDWYQQRFNRLRRWVDEEVRPLSAETATRYFAICANGAPAPHEDADWRGTMHSLTMARDAALAEVERLRDGLQSALCQLSDVTGERDEARADVSRVRLAGERALACCIADLRQTESDFRGAQIQLDNASLVGAAASHAAAVERDEARAEVERLRKDLAHSEQRAGMHPSCPHCGRVTGNEELPDGRECCVADIDRARAIRCGCPKEEP